MRCTFTALGARDLTAERGTDFSLQPSHTTIASGATMSSIMVEGISDGIDEGGEIFELFIFSDPAYALGTPSKATVYIQDVAVVCTYTKQSENRLSGRNT